MHAAIQRAALRAAAKLVLSTTMLGCGETTVTTAPTSPAPTPSTPSPSPTEQAVPLVTTVKHPTPAEAAATQSCIALVRKAYPEGKTVVSDNQAEPAPNVSPDVRQCCTMLAAAADDKVFKQNDPSGFDFPQRGTCCDVIGFNHAGSCTPWGPPVPPPMPRGTPMRDVA